MEVNVRVNNDLTTEVFSVVAEGPGYGQTHRSFLSRQADGSYAGTSIGLKPAAVGYEGYRKPVRLGVEAIAKALAQAAALGPGYHTVWVDD